MERYKTTDLQEEVGYNLADLRKAKKLTQRQAAEITGINTGTLCTIEKGKQNITIGMLEKLTTAYGKKVKIEFI